MTRARLIPIWLVMSILLAACGGGGNATPIPTAHPPTPSATPLSTALPTVAPQPALGSAERPYHMALAATDSGTAAVLIKWYLNDHVAGNFVIDVLATPAAALEALCSGGASFVWLDGAGLLAALARGCGTPTLKIEHAATDGSLTTGLRADLIVRIGGNVINTPLASLAPTRTPIASLAPTQTTSGPVGVFRGKDFCRLVEPDATSWILPALSMRAAGLNPATDLKGLKLFNDTESMLQGLADGLCVGAGIPSGTLNSYSPTLPTGVSLAVLVTTPELPYGGLLIGVNVPSAIAEAMTTVLAKPPNALSSLLQADAVTTTSPADYADFNRVARAAGLNLDTLGQ